MQVRLGVAETITRILSAAHLCIPEDNCDIVRVDWPESTNSFLNARILPPIHRRCPIRIALEWNPSPATLGTATDPVSPVVLYFFTANLVSQFPEDPRWDSTSRRSNLILTHEIQHSVTRILLLCHWNFIADWNWNVWSGKWFKRCGSVCLCFISHIEHIFLSRIMFLATQLEK